MIPKLIHLCWFSNDPYPVEIKVCFDSWKRVIPDYEIKLWGYKEAKAIGCHFIDEALEEKRWAFAADAVRFYAVYKYGGLYMDSDIFLFKRFDDFVPDTGFMTFNEKVDADNREFGLQAAFFMGEAGNSLCKAVFEHYQSTHYRNEDGTLNNTISPLVMARIAEKKFGYRREDTFQDLGEIKIYPTHFFAPRNKYKIDKYTFGIHRIYGSWRKRKFGRKVEIWIRHQLHVLRYALFKR